MANDPAVYRLTSTFPIFDGPEEEDVHVAVSLYICSLLPAPQYSYGLPGHGKEQSNGVVAGWEEGLRVLPQ